MTSSNRIAGEPPADRPRRQARPRSAVSRAAQLVMAFGPCPIWISGLLLAYQALAELGDATGRQAAQ